MSIQSLLGLQVRKDQVHNTKGIHKFGFNSSVGNSEVTISDNGSDYDALTSPSIVKISSSSTADTSDGTGARTINISGLDENYNEISEDITLNGQTAVNSTNSYIRVFRAKVLTAGSGGANAGDIHIGTGAVSSGVPATSIAKISIGENQTLMAVWTVPAGYTGYLYQIEFSSNVQGSVYLTARVKIREFEGVYQTKEKGTFTTDALKFDLELPTVITEKSDIKLTCIASANTHGVSGSFILLYVKN